MVVGSGSAGRRHVAAMRRLLPDVPITVVRRSASEQPTDALDAAGAVVVASLTEVAGATISVGVVAGPAPFHAAAAGELAALGAALLVEKPLAATADDARLIVDAADHAGVPLVVGYHLRYGDTVPKLRDHLPLIGEVTGFSFAVGQHLDQWRPGVDPRRSVTARHELGGGVLLELSHELDGVRYVLGDVESVSALTGVDGAPTDGIVDTVADLDLVLVSGVRGTVHLDMIAPIAHRTWTITGTTGSLTADLIAGVVEHRRSDGSIESVEATEPGERDRAEDRLMANVVDTWRGVAEPSCTGADGVAALLIVDAARESAADGGAVRSLPDPGRPVPQEESP